MVALKKPILNIFNNKEYDASIMPNWIIANGINRMKELNFNNKTIIEYRKKAETLNALEVTQEHFIVI
jgi:hypothetical protein